MERKTIVKVLGILKYTYPNSFKNFNKNDAKAMTDVWYHDFKDVDSNIFQLAIERIRNKNKFFPSIYEVKEEINAITNENMRYNPQDEWEKVRQLMIKYGYYQSDKALIEMKPLTKQCVRNLGGFQNLCQCDHEALVWKKKEFIEMFNGYKEDTNFILSLNENSRLDDEKSFISNFTEIKKIGND